MATLKRTVKTSKNKISKPAAASKKTVKKPAAKKIETPKKTISVKAEKRTVAKPKKKTATKPASVKPASIRSVTAKPATAPINPSKPKKKLSEREERLHKIKLHLIRQRTALLDGAEQALNEQLPGQTIFPDLGDQATAETDRNFMLRLRGREQRLLNKINEAIDRIDSGIFGICDDCGNEIDVKRLEVRPVTTMCIECKTLQEEEEKLREN
ncbi:MAG: TraR/DksA C4-type zinc finger protein [Thermodesulfovibrionales bacterium]